MNRTQAKRLLKLADDLTANPKDFYFGRYVAKRKPGTVATPLENGWGDTAVPTPEEAAKGCGTLCCAIGRLPRVFPQRFEYAQDQWDESEATLRNKETGTIGFVNGDIYDFFGISGYEYEYLFVPGPWNGLTVRTRAPTVAKHIRAFVAERHPELVEATA